jgi:hypothetical protein
MRLLNTLACSVVAATVLAVAAAAADPNVGVLSVEQGKGVVMLDIRGSVLGRLTSGSLRVTDLTPRDRYNGLVVGRKLTQERVGPRITLYRGQGLRFRMVGGGYRIVVRGVGIDLSAVGRGVVTVQGERTLPGEDAGVYSLDGVDCELEPTRCTALPDFPERYVLEPPEEASQRAMIP